MTADATEPAVIVPERERDPLAPLLAQFGLNARVFHSGELCGAVTFDGTIGLGYLHVLRSGRLEVHRPGVPRLDVDVPSFLFFPRAVEHRFKVDAPGAAEMVCATFDFGGDGANPVFGGLPDLVVAPLDGVAGVRTATELLFDEAFSRRAGRDVSVDRLADYFLVLLLRHALENGILGTSVLAGYADARLARALTAMHTHPARDWTLELLADEAGMSRARFADRFKSATGQTALDYLTDWRIAVAQNMLRRGKPLKSIAPAVGYASPEAFSRVFLRRVGHSPAEWFARRQTAPATNVPYRAG